MNESLGLSLSHVLGFLIRQRRHALLQRDAGLPESGAPTPVRIEANAKARSRPICASDTPEEEQRQKKGT